MRVVIRDYNQELDNPYIYSTWSKYDWYSPKEVIKEPKKTWFKQKIQAIKQALETGLTKVACKEGDPTFFMGYIVARQGAILKLCVKKNYRDQGIEELLLKSIQEKNDVAGNEDEPAPRQD